MNNLRYFVCNFLYIYHLGSLFLGEGEERDKSFVQFCKEVKYRALALLFIYICFLVLFISSQSNSDDFSSEDERLGSLSLGVRKAE